MLPHASTGLGGPRARTAPNGAVAAVQFNQMLTAKDFSLVNVHVPHAGELAQTDAFMPYSDIE